MSHDYPDYLKIRERSKLLGWVWRIGDTGYYIGLIGTIISFFMIATAKSAVRQMLIVLGFLTVLIISIFLKRIAHSRTGIHELKDDKERVSPG
jgi:ABC-type polysaccharide/polyol phosphate export permease